MLILLYKKGFGQPYYETKFVLPVEAGPALAAFLRRVYPSSSPYWQSKLTTTYYDDLALSSYWESRDGLLNKMKYRFRQYFNPSGVGADYGIEIKRREGPLTNKTKILLKAAGTQLSPMTDFGSLLDRLRSVPGASAAVLRAHVRHCLRPTLAISCERLRFVNQRAQERYSLDQNIACVAMPGLSGWRRPPGGVSLYYLRDQVSRSGTGSTLSADVFAGAGVVLEVRLRHRLATGRS